MDMILNAVTVYGVVGGAVAVAFLLIGFDRVDPAARGAWLVRPLLMPGLVLLWPVVLARWIALERRRGDDT
ncbi:MAG: hypothetical protein ACT4OK_22775 [Gemmobacter sp.]